MIAPGDAGPYSGRVDHDDTAQRYWLGDALTVGDDGLLLDGVPLAGLARRLGTPLYVYGRQTLARRFAELRAALDTTGRRYEIRFAMKSNRFGPVLSHVRGEAGVKIDSCSPREVLRAMEHGFSPAEISLTAGMLSERDLAQVVRLGVHPNLDTFSVLRRWAAALDAAGITGAGRRIGLRINPEVAVGWGTEPKLAYGNSKFGFDQDRVLEAAAFAERLGLVVDEVHMHVGWGLQRSAEGTLREVFTRLAGFAAAMGTVEVVNVGGGLCWKHRPEDQPLPLSSWAGIVGEALAALPREVGIACEPGTFITSASGVLVVEVNTVEARRSGTWIGVDAGHAVNVFAAHYGIPMAFVPVKEPLAEPSQVVHIGGNINEANDVFARDRAFPAVAEGDLLALWPAGGYGSSMASDHCLRGQPAEVLVG